MLVQLVAVGVSVASMIGGGCEKLAPAVLLVAVAISGWAKGRLCCEGGGRTDGGLIKMGERFCSYLWATGSMALPSPPISNI